MKKLLLLLAFIGLFISSYAQEFTLKSALSYPFPSELKASGNKIAWAANEQGKRNIYVAEAPNFVAKKITQYDVDDAQELTSVQISTNGQWVVFVRGGEHSAGDKSAINPASMPTETKVEVFSVPFAGGKVNNLGEGDYPVISPNAEQVLFTKAGKVLVSPINASEKAKSFFHTKGNVSSLKYSPDGKKVLFSVNRTDHAFIGVYTDDKTPIKWIEPGYGTDINPVWSTDGKNIAFVRRSGATGIPDSILVKKHSPWSIWVASAETGKGKQIWKAPKTLRGSFPSVAGGANLNWANNGIVYLSYEDGWPHLYSIQPDGTNRLLLTPGNYQVENVSLSPDKNKVVFCANTGENRDDIDRRHVFTVSANKADMTQLSVGTGIESFPLMLADNKTIVCFSATAQQPLMPSVLTAQKTAKIIAPELIPSDFPSDKLVTPTHVTFKASDGVTVYAQLFKPKNSKGKSPAIVYIHGGPERQMLLGWSAMDYYSINYATNQYLVSLGFTVLSVNYRLGIGYGYEYHKAQRTGPEGAEEYLDILAAGEWLTQQKDVDANKIGVYGGSYGGFLTGLALGKDSKLFKAGVNIHGVNNRFREKYTDKNPDYKKAMDIELKSIPISYVDTWKSPTLLIHGDDDRNVEYDHTIHLARVFEEKGVPFEYIGIPDETHHWMKFSNTVLVSEATAEFLNRHLNKK